MYAVRARDKNSKFPISKTNAQRVYSIVNAKMNKHKEEQRNKNYNKPRVTKTTERPYPEVKIIRKRTTRTIASGGNARR